MTPNNLLLWCLLIPLLGAMGIGWTRNRPNVREAVTLVTASLLFIVVCRLLFVVMNGLRPENHLLDLGAGISILFSLEPLGMLFALIASGLWLINSVYSIGYMRSNKEKNQTRFYIFFSISLCGAMGVALAGNLATLFIFYEVLTLATYPLVCHKGDEKARRGGRIYLGILLSTSICLFLFAIIWTYTQTGTLTFTPGGILRNKLDGVALALLLALFVFGIGKAALMPFHYWLPAAMVAPTPVSALLHAVAVVKAGVFSVVKVVVYIFGIDYLQETHASDWLVWVAAFTLLSASFVALTKDNLKARLAYSTVSQLAYVVLGAALASAAGIMAAAVHIAAHAVGKITLFFCAGAIYTATGKTEVSQLNGLGRRMPFTFAAFLLGSLSIIGIPPLVGMWTKWFLLLGAAETERYILIAVICISSLLNVAYLLSIVGRGFFIASSPPDNTLVGKTPGNLTEYNLNDAPLLCLLPLLVTALACILLFFLVDPITALIQPITVKQ